MLPYSMGEYKAKLDKLGRGRRPKARASADCHQRFGCRRKLAQYEGWTKGFCHGEAPSQMPAANRGGISSSNGALESRGVTGRGLGIPV